MNLKKTLEGLVHLFSPDYNLFRRAALGLALFSSGCYDWDVRKKSQTEQAAETITVQGQEYLLVGQTAFTVMGGDRNPAKNKDTCLISNLPSGIDFNVKETTPMTGPDSYRHTLRPNDSFDVQQYLNKDITVLVECPDHDGRVTGVTARFPLTFLVEEKPTPPTSPSPKYPPGQQPTVAAASPQSKIVPPAPTPSSPPVVPGLTSPGPLPESSPAPPLTSTGQVLPGIISVTTRPYTPSGRVTIRDTETGLEQHRTVYLPRPVIRPRNYLLYNDGESLEVRVQTKLISATGKQTNYLPSSCSTKAQPQSWPGRLYGPVHKFNGKLFRLPLSFNPAAQVQSRDWEGPHSWTPYRLLIDCKDKKNKYSFPPYELGILVQKPLPGPPENKAPICKIDPANYQQGKLVSYQRGEEKILSFRINEDVPGKIDLDKICHDPEEGVLTYKKLKESEKISASIHTHKRKDEEIIPEEATKTESYLMVRPDQDEYTVPNDPLEFVRVEAKDDQGNISVIDLSIFISPVNDPPRMKDRAYSESREILHLPYDDRWTLTSCADLFYDPEGDLILCRASVACDNGFVRKSYDGTIKIDPECFEDRKKERHLVISAINDKAARDDKEKLYWVSFRRPLSMIAPKIVQSGQLTGVVQGMGDGNRAKGYNCGRTVPIIPQRSLLRGITESAIRELGLVDSQPITAVYQTVKDKKGELTFKLCDYVFDSNLPALEINKLRGRVDEFMKRHNILDALKDEMEYFSSKIAYENVCVELKIGPTKK